ncbi:MAG: putative oxidoreductase [Aeromicrobium sp.]|nr:putative oxidoreductase [Aeromicrobium sp.]
MTHHVAVIGATGDVGTGIVRQALARGWRVTGVGRDHGRLAALRHSVDHESFDVRAGSLTSVDDAQRLADELDLTSVTSLVVAVSAQWGPRPALEVSWPDAEAHLSAYLGQHVIAATTLVPRLPAGSTFIAIGGGMADFPARGMSVISMAQAAQRMWMRHVEKEAIKAHGVHVREVMIHAMVAGEGVDVPAGGMSASAVGAGVCAVIEDPTGTDGPIVSISAGS